MNVLSSRIIGGVLVVVISSTTLAFGQRQELGLTLGGVASTDRTSAAGVPFMLGSALTLEANYGYRLLRSDSLALYIGTHFLASPLREVSSADKTLTRDIATIYVTPGLMLKALPKGRFIPWATVGGGIAIYEQSLQRLDGASNPATREVSHGAFMVGGGGDVAIWRFLALRAEIRNFHTGNRSYNTRLRGGQNDVVTGGGFVLHFGGREK